MSGRPRRDEHTELTRRAVLDAAASRFADPGFAATTIDAIARAARVSKGAVYHHFADKASLYEALWRDREEAVLASVRAAAQRRADPWARLDAAIASYVEAVASDPVHRALLAQGPVALGPRRWRELDGELAVAALLEAVEATEATGRLRRARGEMLARVLTSAMREAAMTAGDAGGEGTGTRADGGSEGAAARAARHEATSVLTTLTAGLRGRPLSAPGLPGSQGWTAADSPTGHRGTAR